MSRRTDFAPRTSLFLMRYAPRALPYAHIPDPASSIKYPLLLYPITAHHLLAMSYELAPQRHPLSFHLSSIIYHLLSINYHLSSIIYQLGS